MSIKTTKAKTKTETKIEVKTEKEKMLAGMLYDASDETLLKERTEAREMVYALNHLKPSELSKGKDILSRLIKMKGNGFIEPPFRCDYGYNIELGHDFYANYNLIILDCAKVIIGDNVLIGPNVGIYTATHPIDPVTRKKGLEYAKPITIGNNVWIGGHVVINPGVSIGDHSIIGSGSVVTKDIPSHVIATGNPCKVKSNID